MDTGLIFALLTAMLLGASAIFLRRGVLQVGESFSAVLVVLFIGTLSSACMTFFFGDWVTLGNLSWQGYTLLTAAGVIHFVFGRFLSYTCIQFIGANRAAAIFKTQMFYAVFLGIVMLGEPLTGFLVAGVLLITAGATIASIQKRSEVTRVRGIGVLAGFAGSFFWGISSVMVKPVITELGSSHAAIFVSFLAAFIFVVPFLLLNREWKRLLELRRESLIPFVLAGLCNSTAQLLRYAALNYSPVSLVVPIMATSAIFTLIFSYFFNRKIEVFTWRIFVGIVAAVVGTFSLFQ